jgi:hypothetical protein
VDRSEVDITGSGFNCVKFDPRKPARTIRRNDGNLGMHGAMCWDQRRRFSLPEFKRFGSFPDGVVFTGEFARGSAVGTACRLFMKACGAHPAVFIREGISRERL